MSRPDGGYESVRGAFRWEVPEHHNLGVDVCDRWALHDPSRTALINEHADGRVERYSYADIRRLSNQAANLLRAQGVQRGDRVAILLPQAPETAVMHVAVYKYGAVAVPLFTLFAQEALEFRLRDSGTRLLVTDRAGANKVTAIRDRLPQLSCVLVTTPRAARRPVRRTCMRRWPRSPMPSSPRPRAPRIRP